MNIPRPLKLVILVLTLWQPLYIAAFMAMAFTGGAFAPHSEASFDVLMHVHMATMIASIVLLVFYIVHVFKARSVASDKRALWGITLFCAAPIAMPIYFFAHVWPEHSSEWAIDQVVKTD